MSYGPGRKKGIIPYCRDENIAFIPYGLLAQGLLTDTGLEKLHHTPEGFRHKMLLYQKDVKDAVQSQLLRIRENCRKQGWSVEHAVILYTQERTQSPSLLLGTRTRKQAEKDFNLPDSPLPDEIRTQLDRSRSEIDRYLPEADNMFGHKS